MKTQMLFMCLAPRDPLLQALLWDKWNYFLCSDISCSRSLEVASRSLQFCPRIWGVVDALGACWVGDTAGLPRLEPFHFKEERFALGTSLTFDKHAHGPSIELQELLSALWCQSVSQSVSQSASQSVSRSVRKVPKGHQAEWWVSILHTEFSKD
jgi:hypothetical protein